MRNCSEGSTSITLRIGTRRFARLNDDGDILVVALCLLRMAAGGSSNSHLREGRARSWEVEK